MNFLLGDVHGCCDQLEKLLEEIHKRDSNPTVFCTGDLCDRGPNTKGVVDLVIKESIQCCRGNHDDIFDCVLSLKPTLTTEDQTFEAPLASLDWFRDYGMYETFASYGQDRDAVKAGLKGLEALGTLAANVPKEHHEFFSKLPLIIECDTFFIAHAALAPELALMEAQSQDIYRKALIWGRYSMQQIMQKKVWEKVGYFGHTPTNHYGDEFSGKPIFGNNVVLLDTGAVFGRGLTAICHETQEVMTA